MPNLTLLFAAALLLTNTISCAPKKEPKMQSSESSHMSSDSIEKISFAILNTTRYAGTGNPDPDAALSQDMGTPPQLFWIRNESGFAKYGLAKKVQSSDTPKAPETLSGEPHFNLDDVLVLTMGVQGTTGFNINLEYIEKRKDEIRLMLKTTEPGPHDAVGEAITHPLVTIVVRKLPSHSKISMYFNGKPTKFQQKILE